VALSPGLSYVSRDGDPSWRCTPRAVLLLCTWLVPDDLEARDRDARAATDPASISNPPRLLLPGDSEQLVLHLQVAPDAPASALVRLRLLTPGDGRPANDFDQVEAEVGGGAGPLRLPALAEPWRTLVDPAWTPPVVVDWLPEGLSYREASGAGWACDGLGPTVLCTVPAGGEGSVQPRLTLSVDVSPDAPAWVVNLAGLSTAPQVASEPAALAAHCAPVQDSSVPALDQPPLCAPAAAAPDRTPAHAGGYGPDGLNSRAVAMP
jgi:hypothetical protein